MPPNPPVARSDVSIRRGLLPEVLTPSDLAVALDLPSAAAARRLLYRGALCPFARVGSRLYVRRDTLMRALAERERGAPAGDVVSLLRPAPPDGEGRP